LNTGQRQGRLVAVDDRNRAGARPDRGNDVVRIQERLIQRGAVKFRAFNDGVINGCHHKVHGFPG
jgi:hypothetical protein